MLVIILAVKIAAEINMVMQLNLECGILVPWLSSISLNVDFTF